MEKPVKTATSYSKVDEYGFQRPDNFDYDAYERFMSEYMTVLIRRARRWNTLNMSKLNKNNKLRRFVRKGIPIDLRPAVWMQISGAEQLKNESLLSYEELKSKITPSAITESIEIDLPRTFPDNIFFSKHEYLPKQLFSVLAAFAHQNIEVGYCQGLNYIAGLLLLATKNEEASFWLLKALVEKILPKYYVKNMSGLITDLDVLDELVKKIDPQVYRHIKQLSMPWAMGTTKWFVCVYSEVLPTETVLRIWDCLFYEGSKILFRVGLMLIKLHREQILQTKELGELITSFKDMRNHETVINCHFFINEIFKQTNVSNSQLEKLRIKYRKK